MDTTTDPPFDESLAQVVRALPSPIRKFFLSGKVEAVSKVLFETFRLHVDQGAILERELILLLLGLKSPVEFMETLREEGHIDAETVKRIANEANTRIFLPLREEMRKGAAGRERADEISSAGAPVGAPATPSVSVPRYAPPQDHSQTALRAALQVPAPPAAAPAARPPITDPERELPAGEPLPPPAPSPASAPRSFVQPGPAPSSPPRSSSAPLPPRAVLPGALRSAALLPTAPTAPRRESPTRGAPPANLPGAFAPKPLPAPTESHSEVDPYREPIDEK